MTNEELIARLRAAGKHPMMDSNCKVDVFVVHDTADRIEALISERDGLAPVERPPEPYDEYGWQTADTAERHAQMVLGRDLWAVADFARAALARVKGVM